MPWVLESCRFSLTVKDLQTLIQAPAPAGPPPAANNHLAAPAGPAPTGRKARDTASVQAGYDFGTPLSQFGPAHCIHLKLIESYRTDTCPYGFTGSPSCLSWVPQFRPLGTSTRDLVVPVRQRHSPKDLVEGMSSSCLASNPADLLIVSLRGWSQGITSRVLGIQRAPNRLGVEMAWCTLDLCLFV